MREDTADCIAKEMMDDLSLSEDEAAKIAKKIKEEIGRLVSGTGSAGNPGVPHAPPVSLIAALLVSTMHNIAPEASCHGWMRCVWFSYVCFLKF